MGFQKPEKPCTAPIHDINSASIFDHCLHAVMPVCTAKALYFSNLDAL